MNIYYETETLNMSEARDSVKIFANIFISFIGAGVLGLPYAFKKAGLLEGILVMSLVSYFSVKAMLLLIDCKYKVLNILNSGPENGRKRSLSRGEKTKTLDGNSYVELKCSDVDEDDIKGEKNNIRSRHVSSSRVSSTEISYSDIGFSALGMPGRTLVDFSLLLSQIGFCCAYLIFITENLSSFMPSVDKNQWLAMLLPPLFILTLIKDLSKFALFSLFAQVSNLFAFTIVYWFDFQHLHLAQVDPKEFSLEGLPYFFSVAIYCYEGAGMILSLESSVAEDLRDKFKQFFIRTIIVITTLYITFGAAGYLSYGNDTRDIITLNLPNSGGLNSSLIVKSCLCIRQLINKSINQ
ncbi:amino acid transporter ANT1 [Eurytemora carolleeae]|uniref:amino acid transporter ANT1 n=1 Tax=Eurytemora carolleeae TaxID=1294199 RepID=UPI000C773FA3|nr:amino acid transporter ANT1 [Eurytemora carolleeae]|eukprot:XP_023332674.1 amino acid transporter ANT1-like [Eurytemora affinis]